MPVRSPFKDLLEEHTALVAEAGDLLASMRGFASPNRESLGRSSTVLRDGLGIFSKHLNTHFRREEEALFPEAQRLVSEGAQGADIFGRFFAEEAEDDMGAHAALAARTNEMVGLTAQLGDEVAGDPAGARKLLAVGTATVSLLQRHAAKEDSLIFPMIERSLTPAQLDHVRERLNAIGSGRDLSGPSSDEGMGQLGA
jgi:hemerythrin-like domain-containing protein